MWIVNRSDDHLMHHGIKGQKWGVRRFENADGTLTPEGKERYHTDLKTSEDYTNAGERKFDKYNKSVDKFTQDEGISFLENDQRMRSLCKAVDTSIKSSLDRYNQIAKQKQEANSMKFASKDRKRKAIEEANLAESKNYYEYARAFDRAASSYISKNFKPEEQDLARAALFWAFFD